MTLASSAPVRLEHTLVDELAGLYLPWQAEPAPAPRLLVANDELATELGLDPAWVRSDEGVAVLVGNRTPPGAQPVALAYAGHQFGGYSPRLGDGRALLVGELVDGHGRRRDLHLKGSGRTPFARGGDGKAAVGPMLREHVISEAMHGLGIPTTRALAVIATGEDIARETMLPGAVLARVAASHIRVGTFEYAARLEDRSVLRRLADHAIARHHPDLAAADRPYRALLEAVIEAQAALVAQWMAVGFIHGVMNTDNMTISGETIDYGPCAFMDTYDPATVFSSIDHGGRYAFGNQPRIAQWNLFRLAETLLGLLDTAPGGEALPLGTENQDQAALDAAIATATATLERFPDRFQTHWYGAMRTKLGLGEEQHGDRELIDDLLVVLQEARADHTTSFRALAGWLRRGPAASPTTAASPTGVAGTVGNGPTLQDAPGFGPWTARWVERLGVGDDAARRTAVADGMDRANPAVIARNHLVEEALAAASGDGDLAPVDALVEALRHPYDVQPGHERYAEPAPAGFTERYQTFCGT